MRYFLFVLAAGFAASGSARAQMPMGDAARGLELARGVCAECHTVEKGELEPLDEPLSFQRLAHEPAATELNLRAFLRTPHRNMPNLKLTKEQIADVLAYIESLK